MARILIRPQDLARLARRFDASADDVTHAHRRLARRRSEVGLNRADPTFSVAGFAERSQLVEANLERLADEFRVDAALMARTIDGAEFADDGTWTAGLTGPGAGSTVRPVATWAAVRAGLAAVEGPASQVETVGSGQGRSPGPGGLFAMAATEGDGGGELLDRLTDRLRRTPSTGAGSGALWSRIVDELFGSGDAE